METVPVVDLIVHRVNSGKRYCDMLMVDFDCERPGNATAEDMAKEVRIVLRYLFIVIYHFKVKIPQLS